MKITDFDFKLPKELIAQVPLPVRDRSRMLVVNRTENRFFDDHFLNFVDHLSTDDVVVFNNTKVFPARLFGKKISGAEIEIFLVREIEPLVWEALARPLKRLSEGSEIVFDENLRAKILKITEDGRCQLAFLCDGEFFEVIERIGRTPLPPYIRRDNDNTVEDKNRYQTVYAKSRGAIAAPTAGLHFTSEILEKLRERKVTTVEITLHVGYGTFESVRVQDAADHRVSSEQFEISDEAASILNSSRERGSRIVAIGTTTTRALESSLSNDGKIRAGKNAAELTIIPGYKFNVVGAMLTNFHLPQSSLLMLASAFAGHELMMRAYSHAVAERYRFYSYGDCMLIV